MCVLSIKVPIRKKSGNLSNDPRTFGAFYFYFFYYIHTNTLTHTLREDDK